MIATLTGSIQYIETHGVILNVAGVGYRVMLSSRDLSESTQDTEVRIFIYHHIREDAQLLYGFYDVHDVRVFEQLIQVSGVGPKIAQAILSQLSGVEVIDALISQNTSVLTRISGVGKKTAERLVLELRDRLEKNHVGNLEDVALRSHALSTHGDLVQALLALGYRESEVHEVVAGIDATLPLGEQVRAALQQLSKNTSYAR